MASTQRTFKFNPTVVQKLKELDHAVAAAIVTRQQYIQGVLDALGIEGDVNVDLSAMTYTSTVENTPKFTSLN